MEPIVFISSVKVKVGDKVSKGSLIATLSNGNSSKATNDKSILPETEKIIQEAEKVLKITYLEAKLMKSAVIGTEHLLLSILKEEDSFACSVLNKYGII